MSALENTGRKTRAWRWLGSFANSSVGARLYRAAGPMVNAVAGRTQTPKLGDIPWAPFRGDLSACRVALASTAGFHLAGEAPFDVEQVAGDPSFREIPASADPRSLAITHAHYPHRYAEEDPNVLLPLDRLRELRDEGVLRLAPRCFSFGFAGTLTGPLVDDPDGSAHEVARRLREDGADVLLVAPA